MKQVIFATHCLRLSSFNYLRPPMLIDTGRDFNAHQSYGQKPASKGPWYGVKIPLRQYAHHAMYHPCHHDDLSDSVSKPASRFALFESFTAQRLSYPSVAGKSLSVGGV